MRRTAPAAPIRCSDPKLRSTITGVEMFRKILDRGEAGDNLALLRGAAGGAASAKPRPASMWKYRLYGPGQAHWGSAKFTSACTLGAARNCTAWFMAASKGKNIRKNITINLRGHRDVGGYRAALIVPIAMDKGLRFAVRKAAAPSAPGR